MQLYVFLLFFHGSSPPGYSLILVFLPVFTPPTDSLGGINFITEEGKGITGYTLTGADTVYPFKKIIDLGIGTSFDISNYNSFENFTVDNFIIELESSSSCEASVQYSDGYDYYAYSYSTVTPYKSYDNATGILTAYVNVHSKARYGRNYPKYGESSVNANVHAYLIK